MSKFTNKIDFEVLVMVKNANQIGRASCRERVSSPV